MSNKYFRNWEKNNKNDDLDHLNFIKKINEDNDRLDRAIDKIKTDKKAKDIFAFDKYQNSHIVTTNVIQPIQLIQPIQIVQQNYQIPKYAIVNGCIVLLPHNY